MDRWVEYPFQDSVAQKYQDDRDFALLVDTFTAMLWDGRYTVSELRKAAIFDAMRVEAIRIRPMLFDPNNYSIEYGVLKQVRDEGKESKGRTSFSLSVNIAMLKSFIECG